MSTTMNRTVMTGGVLAVAVSLAICSIDAQGSKPIDNHGVPGSMEQKFLCERSYINFAWGYQHSGTYVDSKGGVYRYKAGRQVTPKQKRALTEVELEAKYAQGRTLLRTVPTDDFGQIRRLIAEASKGSYSEKVQRAADAGATVVSCYLYDENAKTYREIELDVRGDWSYHNVSPAARQLTEWLTTISKP
jgi:hypothetical protein